MPEEDKHHKQQPGNPEFACQGGWSRCRRVQPRPKVSKVTPKLGHTCCMFSDDLAYIQESPRFRWNQLCYVVSRQKIEEKDKWINTSTNYLLNIRRPTDDDIKSWLQKRRRT